MKQYIEKAALMDHVEREARRWGFDYDYEQILGDIEDFQTADVRPVVRGKWEVVDWVEYDGHGECVHYPKEGLCCTNCKNAFKKKLLWKDNYCPNCGADMREVEP